VIDSTILLGIYAVVLLFVLGQKAFYFGLLRTILTRQNATAGVQDDR
jgi:Mg2+/citrate symporter